MTDRPPNIVVLSNDTDDVGLVDAALAATGNALNCTQVEDSGAFRRLLEQRSVDLIVIRVDRFPATIKAVVELRDVFYPEIPIVAMQSTVDDVSLQKAVDAGANDLVSVAGTSRLRAVFARELRTLRMERALNSRIMSPKTTRPPPDDCEEGANLGAADVSDGVVRRVGSTGPEKLDGAAGEAGSGTASSNAHLGPMHDRDDIVAIVRGRLAEKPASGLYALAYIRPDRVSEIRDAVGALNIQQVLDTFAATVGELLHPDDVAGRLDETAILALLLRGNERAAVHWAQAVVDKVRNEVYSAGEKSISLTCTVGICAVGAAHSGLEDILAAAVEAHRQGRRKSGNTVMLDQAGEDNARMREVDEFWVGRIRSALSDNGFRLARLPIVPLRAEESGYFDLLIRMLGEDGEEILPADFLPSARRHDLMSEIDCWVIDNAMVLAGHSDVRCAFLRLSTQSILDTAFMSKIDHYANKHRTNPAKICFQLAMDVADKYVQQTKTIVDELRSGGYRIALEHYPTNRQSSRILDTHNPDFLKIDGEFMHSLASDSLNQAGVQSIVNAARERGIQTIAERVEYASTMAVLYRLGVHFMQGNYVQQPEIVLVQAG